MGCGTRRSPQLKAQIISFRCTLRNNLGKILSSAINHDVYTQPDHPGRLLKGLVEGLHGVRTGDKRNIFLTAEQAYGLYQLSLVISIPRTRLANCRYLQMGQQVIAETNTGKKQVFSIIGMTADTVTLDGNHPLAGQDLTFEIEALDARDATSEEIAAASGKRLH